jgi:hypothetical protein
VVGCLPRKASAVPSLVCGIEQVRQNRAARAARTVAGGENRSFSDFDICGPLYVEEGGEAAAAPAAFATCVGGMD